MHKLRVINLTCVQIDFTEDRLIGENVEDVQTNFYLLASCIPTLQDNYSFAPNVIQAWSGYFETVIYLPIATPVFLYN